MRSNPGRALRAALWAGALLVIVGVLYFYRVDLPWVHTSQPAAHTPSRSAEATSGKPAAAETGRAGPGAAERPGLPPQIPESPEAARVRARATLQSCLTRAKLASKTSWDNMCTALAQKNAADRESCRLQGLADADCRARYPDTPQKECLLPHATANSIADAQQSASRDCYDQFQAVVH